MKTSIRIMAVAFWAWLAPASAQTFIVKPGVVEAASGSAPAAQTAGSFALTPKRNSSSSRSGGACLVFQPVARRHGCTSDAQCQQEANRLFGKPAGGYCVARAGLSKQCWYRPPEAPPVVDARGFKVSRHCVKSGTGPLPVVTRIRLAPVDAFPLGPQPTRWRVTTCHNLVPPNAHGLPACAWPNAIEGRDKVTRYGPARRFQP